MSLGRVLVSLLVVVSLAACHGDPGPSQGGPDSGTSSSDGGGTPSASAPVLPQRGLGESTVGASFSASLAATGGTSPLVYSATGLPDGVSLDSGSGAVSGSPTAAGTFDVTVSVGDAAGRSDSRHYSFRVYEAPRFVTTELGAATAGAPFTAVISLAGGKPPVVLGGVDLPAGVTVESASGAVQATFPAEGTVALTLTATDALGATTVSTFHVSVAPALVFNTGLLQPASATLPYSARIEAAGGQAPRVLTLGGGSFPPGLSLSAQGDISGTPTTPGAFRFEVIAIDGGGATLRAWFDLTVRTAPPVFATSALPDGYASQPYSANLAATGGTPPYVFSPMAGALPDGLALSASGAITGTPTTAGTASFTAEVKDATGQFTQKAFSLTVIPALTVATTSLPDAYLGSPYPVSITASGGKAPYVFTQTGGALPDGLKLGVDGRFSGAPTVAGAFGLTVRVDDDSQQSTSRALALTVYSPPSFASTVLRKGTMGAPYAETFQTTGGKAPLSFSVSGALPDGVQLSGDTLRGTPTTAGTFTFSVTVTDANGKSSIQGFSLTISSDLTILTASLPDAYTDKAYSQALAAAGGVAPYTWVLESGAPPSGIQLQGSGTLAGTPSSATSGTFTVRLNDNAGHSTTQAFTLAAYAPPSLNVPALTGYVSDAYSRSLDVTGGKAPFTFTRSGTLPPGLDVSSAGLLQGTPTTSGSYAFSVTAMDVNGRATTASLSMSIAALPAVSTTTLPEGDVGKAYNTRLAASGGSGTLTWTQPSGSLPPGLQLASDGTLSGTPSTEGTFSFTARVSDGTKSDSRTLSAVIHGVPTINAVSLKDAYVGTAYSATLTATGGTPPLSWTSTGTLPAGLGFSSSGVLSGTPTAAGASSGFTVRVTDARGNSATQALSFTAYVAPSVTTTTLPDAYVSEAYGSKLSASGGKPAASPPYTFAVSTGALPAGLQLAVDGTLQGTPTTPGTASFQVTASDANQQPSTPRALTLAVYTLPAITTATLPEAQVGQAYSASLTATGGKATLAWSQSGLPQGLTLSASGALSGTPSASGSFTVTFTVTDANGRTARAALPLTVKAAPSASTPFTVAHWNIEWFGDPANGPSRSTSPGGTNDDLQLAHARDIIRDAGVDVWGLAEIVSVADFEALKAQLPGYDGFVASDTTRVPGGSSWYSSSEQKPAVLYNSRLTFQHAELILTDHDYDFAGRPPLRVDFTISINGSPQKLIVIVLHMKAMDDTQSYARRQQAELALKQYLDTQLPLERVFVVGDWNDDVDQSITWGGSSYLASPYQDFVSDSADYTFITRALSLAHTSSTATGPETIDHTLVTNELASSYVPNSVTVLRPDTWVSDYVGTTSDHFPVLSRYDFGAASSEPAVVLRGPNAGTYQGGSTLVVSWSSTNVATVDLEYSLDGGFNFLPLATGVDASQGQYLWTVPNVDCPSVTVRVSATGSPWVVDSSDAPIAFVHADAKVFINEFLANEPNLTQPDGGIGTALTAYEFVELVNGGTTAADLEGWTLWDALQARHTFAAGTVLAPGQAFVVYGGASAVPPDAGNMVSASSGTLGLGNSSDTVTLKQPDAGIVDAYTYSSTVDNVSFNRATDGDPNSGFVLHTDMSALPSSAGLRADGGAW